MIETAMRERLPNRRAHYEDGRLTDYQAPAGLLARDYLRRESGLYAPSRKITRIPWIVPQRAPAEPLQAIGTPTSVGFHTVGSTSASSITFSTSANIAAGNLLVLAIALINDSTTTRTVSSISDGTNSYTHAASRAAGGAAIQDIEIWYVQNAAAVASGATITITLSGALTTGAAVIGAYQVSGIASSGALDSSNTGTSNGSSYTTGTLASAYEIVFGSSIAQGSGVSFTESSNFTNLYNNTATGSVEVQGSLGYYLASSTSAVTYSPTVGGLDACVGVGSFIGFTPVIFPEFDIPMQYTTIVAY